MWPPLGYGWAERCPPFPPHPCPLQQVAQRAADWQRCVGVWADGAAVLAHVMEAAELRTAFECSLPSCGGARLLTRLRLTAPFPFSPSKNRNCQAGRCRVLKGTAAHLPVGSQQPGHICEFGPHCVLHLLAQEDGSPAGSAHCLPHAAAKSSAKHRLPARRRPGRPPRSCWERTSAPLRWISIAGASCFGRVFLFGLCVCVLARLRTSSQHHCANTATAQSVWIGCKRYHPLPRRRL